MKIRAFVLDDNQQVRKAISDLLKYRGYEVHEFFDPSVCPVYLERDCPCELEHACTDIIITDIDMPNVTGIEFIENQKKRSCKVENIAMISGAWTRDSREQAESLGCEIFYKPFDFTTFTVWLDECEKRIKPNRKLSDWFKQKENGSSVK